MDALAARPAGPADRGRPARGRPDRGRPEPFAARPELAALAARIRPVGLAADDVLALDDALAGMLGAPGLRRGWTVVVDGAPGAGATSLLFRLLSTPTRTGAWCALVGLPDLGIVAAEELGVALDRLLVVPEPAGHLAAVVAALLEGCDVVVARTAGVLTPRQASRLAARARERRAVLVVVGEQVGALARRAGIRPAAAWPGEADLTLEAAAASWVGIGEGSGRLVAHGVEVLARRRRGAPGRRRHLIWLQEHPDAPPGEETPGTGASPPTAAPRATG